MIFGYCRVSTLKQSIERQRQNILEKYPEATIYSEVHTRMDFSGRTEWKKIMRRVKPGDTIVFDAVSRMTGEADEGFRIYKELYEKNINLEFLKQPHINTDNYREALKRQIPIGDNDLPAELTPLLRGINEFLWCLAEKQIQLAFESSQKEVETLRTRTKEGLREAAKTKKLGRPAGRHYQTTKGNESRKMILKLSSEFYGPLSNKEVMQVLNLSTSAFYRYRTQCVKIYAEQQIDTEAQGVSEEHPASS